MCVCVSVCVCVHRFADGDEFEQTYNLQVLDGVSALHAALRPHLLRRIIKDVSVYVCVCPCLCACVHVCAWLV